jgi:SAM-dependent methyltransferase
LNWVIYRIHDSQLLQFAQKYLKGRMIDVGCGRKPYKAMMAPFVTEHVGVDHSETRHGLESVDLVGTAYSIPAPDQAFDSSICTAVLEHLEEPGLALAEINRVLKPGAPLILSAPFFWHLHEAPRDFFRYTPYGLRHLLEKAGFEVVEMKALGGFGVMQMTMLAHFLLLLNRGPLRKLKVIVILGALLQLAGWWLDRLVPRENWAWMHICVARKVEAG